MSQAIDRRLTLGASEAPAALGLDKHKSRYQLWAEKTGLIDPPDLSDNEAVQWGNYLQPKVAEVYSARTGRLVRKNQSNRVRTHPRYYFLTATLDATQRRQDLPVTYETLGALEIKTTGAWLADDWQDEPPLRDQVQLQDQLAVTGYTWGTLCCLIGGQRLVWFDAGRDERFIAAMIVQLRAFWHLVETRQPPPVDGSAQTREALRRLFPKDTGESVILPDEAADWDRQRLEAKAIIKAAEARRDEAENKLKAAIGEAKFGVLPDGARYKWKTEARAGYKVEATNVRILRRLKH